MEPTNQDPLTADALALLDYLPGMVFRCVNNPPEWTMTYISAGARRLTGYEPEELLQNRCIRWAQLVHPDDLEGMIQQCDEVSKKKSLSAMEYRIFHKSGGIRWVSEHTIPIEAPDGSVPQLQGFIQDITAIKQATAELEASRTVLAREHRRWEMAVECAGDAICDWDITTDEVKFSALWQALLGLKPEEVDRTGTQLQNRIHPEDYPPAMAELRRHLAGETPNYRIESRLRAGDGSYKWVNVRGGVVERTPDGAPIRMIAIFKDITERREAEARIRSLSDRLALAVEGAGYGIWEYDLRSEHLYGDQVLREVYGFGRGEFDYRLQTWKNLILKEDLARVDAAVERLAAGERILNLTYRIRRIGDGELRYIETHGFPQRDEENRTHRLVGMTRDITEQRETEVALRESEERYTRSLQAVNDGIWDWNVLTGEAYFSPVYYTMLGYEPGEFPADYENFVRLLHPDDSAGLLQELERRVARSKGFEFEFRMKSKSGKWLWILSRGRTMEVDEQGRAIRMMGTHTNITDRKLAEQARQELEFRLRSFIDNGNNVLYTLTPEGVFSFASNNSVALLGMPPEEILGRSFQDMVHPDDVPICREFVDLVLSSGRNQSGVEYRVRHADDSWRWHTSNGSPLRDAGGRVVGIVGVVWEITERKEAEATRERLQRQLIESQRLEALGRLAGGVAHDFNNLLAVILGNVELVLDGFGDGHERREELLQVRDAANRSAALTRQLLTFARQQQVSSGTIDLNSQVQQLLGMLRRLIREDIDVQWNPGPGLPPVAIDASGLDQILTNLLLNARDAIESAGTIRVSTCRAEHVKRPVPSASAGPAAPAWACLQVSDTGAGIPATLLERIFEPFFTTKEIGQGTGLGLATVYGVVEQAQGFIDVQSKLGEGSCFQVYLPCPGEGSIEGSPPPAAPPSEAPAAPPATILVAEDEPSILLVARRVLERAGFKVLAAANGTEALRHAAQTEGPIDLLLTDIVMPGMSGRELRNELLRQRPTLKALFMSGYPDNEFSESESSAPGFAFLQKPFSTVELLAKVRAILAASDSTGSGHPGSHEGPRA